MDTPSYPLRIKRGEDFSFTFDITIDDVVLDLTGATSYSQVRECQNREATLVVEFTTAINGSNEITLSLTDTQTAAITKSAGFYDVLIVDSGGNDTYYLEGPVEIVGSVTVKA